VRPELVELRRLRMPLVHPFETSFGVQHERNVLLAAVSAGGLQGWGECTAGDDPFYSAETPETAWYVLRDYLVPALLEGRISGDPATFADESGFVRGHRMAKATLEAALWHLEALRRDEPLHRLLGGTRSEIATGVSIGIQPTLQGLLERVAEFADRGYRRVKIKIKPGWDANAVAAVRERFPRLPLMVDANCAYSLERADSLEALDRFDLMMIEQPLAAGDLVDHAALQRRLRTPVCLDESIESLADARAALELAACRVVNIKQGRVGGLTRAIGIHDLCREAGVPVWPGGMLETGIGRALNIALATLDNFSLPGDISGSDRYWAEDIIDPPVTVSGEGTIAVPEGPGLGFEPNAARIEKLTSDYLRIRA